VCGGTYLLTLASVIIYKDDVVRFMSLEVKPLQSGDGKGFIDIACNPNEDSFPELWSGHSQTEKVFLNEESIEPDDDHREKPSCAPPRIGSTTYAQSTPSCCEHAASVSSLNYRSISVPVGYGLSKDIKWVDFTCLNCFCTLGAYHAMMCFYFTPTLVFTYPLVDNKYTLERMFAC
ncbi:Proteoglycan 3, partial [Bienertia sinuspersici]